MSISQVQAARDDDLNTLLAATENWEMLSLMMIQEQSLPNSNGGQFLPHTCLNLNPIQKAWTELEISTVILQLLRYNDARMDQTIKV